MQVPTQFESLTQTEKLSQLKNHLLEFGDGIEQNDSTACIQFSSVLDETNCSVPELEELPCPDLT